MDEAKQEEEMAVLSSIYGTDFKILDEHKKVFEIQISSGNDHLAVLKVQLVKNYPSLSPPLFELKAHNLSAESLKELQSNLNDAFKDCGGECILYTWINIINETLSNNKSNDMITTLLPIKDNICSPHVYDKNENLEEKIFIHTEILKETDSDAQVEKAEIVTGSTLTERKSVFQAHLSHVTSLEEVNHFLKHLKESNKKVAQATHNIMAYRIIMHQSVNPHYIIDNDTQDKKLSKKKAKSPTRPQTEQKPKSEIYLQDYDDDGETHAGQRLLHLLQVVDARNVAVVVSRWFGGIKLGPDRFKLINNVARDLLSQCGYIKCVEKIVTSNKSKQKR